MPLRIFLQLFWNFRANRSRKFDLKFNVNVRRYIRCLFVAMIMAFTFCPLNYFSNVRNMIAKERGRRSKTQRLVSYSSFKISLLIPNNIWKAIHDVKIVPQCNISIFWSELKYIQYGRCSPQKIQLQQAKGKFPFKSDLDIGEKFS